MPFSALVDKAMETQGKELLPKIMEVVNALRQAKRIPVQGSESAAILKEEVGEESSVQKTGLEFDLTLPIDLPGLKSSGVNRDSLKKDSGAIKKELTTGESTVKTARIRPRHADSNIKVGSASKLKSENKPHVEVMKDANKKDRDGGQKLPLPVEGKRDSKLKSLKTKKTKEESSDANSHSHSKQKELAPPGEMSERLGENNEANKKDKLASGPLKFEQKKEHSEVNKKDKCIGEIMERREELWNVNRKDESIADRMDKTEEHTPVACMSPQKIGSGQNSNNGNLKQKNESESCFVPSEEDDARRDEQNQKPMPPRRRSARLASLSDDQTKDESCQGEEDLREAAERESMDDKWYKEKMAKTWSNRNKRVGGSSLQSHRRAKAHLDSSSDEFEERRSRSTEKTIVEADEERHSSSKRAVHRKRSLKLDIDPIRCGLHAKRARTLSRTTSPTSTGSSASSMHLEAGRYHKPAKEISKYAQQRSSSLKGTSKSRSPTPVVVTRSNRHVKPNRRYCASDEEELMDEGEESSEEQQQPVQTRKRSKYSLGLKRKS